MEFITQLVDKLPLCLDAADIALLFTTKGKILYLVSYNYVATK